MKTDHIHPIAKLEVGIIVLSLLGIIALTSLVVVKGCRVPDVPARAAK